MLEIYTKYNNIEYPLIRDSICNSTGSHKFKSFIKMTFIYTI